MTSNASQWTNLDLSDVYVVGNAYSRTHLLCREDPFVQMLSDQTITALLAAIFSANGHGIASGEALTVTEPADVLPGIQQVIARSPLAIVNDAFTEHLAALVVRAIFPEQVA